MKYINRIDEQERFYGLKFDPTGTGQEDSHGYSYLYARKMLQDLGDVMGLEAKVEKHENMPKL